MHQVHLLNLKGEFAVPYAADVAGGSEQPVSCLRAGYPTGGDQKRCVMRIQPFLIIALMAVVSTQLPIQLMLRLETHWRLRPAAMQ